MQQLCLTGAHAEALADRLFAALNIRPVGLRVLPFHVDGAPRGRMLHLLPPPAPPALNDVPCQVLLAEGRFVSIPEALEHVAAPGLLAALRIQAPVLLSGLNADLLACPAFCDAVRTCMMSQHPVVITADKTAMQLLQSLVPEEKQVWFGVPDDDDAQAILLESLIPEAALRF